MLRSLSCSQSIRQRIRRRTVTLYFNLHWNFQILVHRSQGIVQLDLLPPQRKTTLLQRSMLSCSGALIQISQCAYRSEPPIPSCSSSGTGSPAKSLSTKTVILSTVSVFDTSAPLWAFPPDIALHVSSEIWIKRCFGSPTRYRAARFSGTKLNSSRFARPLGQNCCCFCKV